MNLKQYDGEKVKIVDVNDQVLYGTVTDYIFPEDNEPEEESIIVVALNGDMLEFFGKNIKKIEVI